MTYIFIFFISDAVKRNKTTAASTKKEVETSLNRWFVGSRDRGGGRIRRAKEANKRRRDQSPLQQ